ncbi:nucleotidyltransferase domain-containing protein [Candidatus Falkowbacteria bacterium]|nr:nucleotidyltransferase domain-containing protein [Candidatus Falkowbacteria bacterium]
MWSFTDRRRIREELQRLLKFLTEYFGTEIQTVVVYGSFLRWSFHKDSDVDVAIILRDSPEWRWSKFRVLLGCAR